MFSFLPFRRNKPAVTISEKELLEFQELALREENEIVGALVGIATSTGYLILNVFKYKERSSSPSSVTYNQLENSFLPAGLENLGTIHSHPGFGAFLSGTDLANLRRGLNRVAIVVDPENLEIKAFEKDGKQIRIEVVEDHEIPRIRVKVFYRYGIPFRIYITPKMELEKKAILKSQIDRRYCDSRLFGIYDLKEEGSAVYYKKPKVIMLKYRNKVPLYFFVKNSITYADWLENAVLNSILDFKFAKCVVIRNGKRIDFEEISGEVVRDGVTEFFLF